MTCTRPVRLGEAEDTLLVPCGRCAACRIRRTSEWAVRLYHERSYWSDASFLTLTYDDEHLPGCRGVHKDELVRYVKRLRQILAPRKVKVFGCGEYGGRFSRAHYHLVVFGLSPLEHRSRRWRGTLEVIEGPALDAWSGGKAACPSRGQATGEVASEAEFEEMIAARSSSCGGERPPGRALAPRGSVYVGTVTYNSCRYVAGYIQKKLFGPPGQVHDSYGFCEAPFQVQSCGIGQRFAMEHTEELLRDGGCTINGRHVGIPRYYCKVSPELKPLLALEREEYREDRAKQLMERLHDKELIYKEAVRENWMREHNAVKRLEKSKV